MHGNFVRRFNEVYAQLAIGFRKVKITNLTKQLSMPSLEMPLKLRDERSVPFTTKVYLLQFLSFGKFCIPAVSIIVSRLHVETTASKPFQLEIR